ncbi:DnaB-like helicase C-terminal domain-containing protein [Streptomyces olivaceus]|uniref:DnaB-like helicase C-terminal domain-containing protein n=1 Tax=Streptomyces olivaceus TaxID=47716 RepID=UPI0012FF578A|nr:DnaB-like helicase C-terminal domain-containing protein [Streptomyces olivaceus]MBZ6107952.1 AAA family ATPase [Streptomyces olivaceus]
MTKSRNGSNTTHQKQIARDLHRQCGCGYQEALRRVREAAEAGLLPPRLDAAGRAAAVAVLAEALAKGPSAARSRPAEACPLPWPGATALAGLAAGRVTALVSLPTAGRSTLALNMALHAAEQGRPALFTSGEITTDVLKEKVIAARYGFAPRRQAPPGGWPAFRASTLPEMQTLPLALHGATAGSTARASLVSGATAIMKRHRRPIGLWAIDTVQHFSEFTDTGLDTAATMRQVRALAGEYNMAVLVTAQVVTDHPAEPVTTAHLPEGVREHAERVMVLDRPGAYWTNSAAAAATLSGLQNTGRPRPVPLTLQFENCRFLSA